MYADLLRDTFPELDPQLDDLFLLEAHQVAALPDRAPPRELGAVLHANPSLRRFVVARHPPIDGFVSSLLAEHPPRSDDDLDECADRLLWELADWIVYQRCPERYDEGSAVDAGLGAITDVVELDGRIILDAGAGTGRIAFAAAPIARHVFAVEPVAALRRYMRDKAHRLGVDNLFVLDGFLDAIPLPAASCDVLLTRQAIGWRLSAELAEVERIVRPEGSAVHLVGMPHPAPDDDRLHGPLVAAGYEPGVYREDGVDKRRYWRHFGR